MTGWGCASLGPERLAGVVRSAYAVELVALEPVDGGADGSARTWRGTDAAGTAWAVKESVGGPSAGLAVAAAVRVPGVPVPERTRDGGLWAEADGARVSLVPWVVGRSALEVDPAPAQWAALGRVLADVHATPTTVLPAGLPRDPRSGDDAAALVATAERAAGRPVDALGRDAAAVWAGARERVLAVLAGVRRTGARPDDAGRTGETDLVVCHGDPHRGNLVVDDDGVRLWLLDWDDAVLSWRERDLLMVVDGLPGFSPVSAQQLAWFEEGYGPVAVDPRRLAHHRGVRALEDVAMFTADALEERRSAEQRAWALGLVRDHLHADGILALAERSLARA